MAKSVAQTRNNATIPFRVSSTAEGDRYAGDATKELGKSIQVSKLKEKSVTVTYFSQNFNQSIYPSPSRHLSHPFMLSVTASSQDVSRCVHTKREFYDGKSEGHEKCGK